jgi:hypothetical protein
MKMNKDPKKNQARETSDSVGVSVAIFVEEEATALLLSWFNKSERPINDVEKRNKVSVWVRL